MTDYHSYLVRSDLGLENQLLAAVAAVGIEGERLVRGFTEVALIFRSDLSTDELDRQLRSPFVGRFGPGWLQIATLTDAEWDVLLEQ